MIQALDHRVQQQIVVVMIGQNCLVHRKVGSGAFLVGQLGFVNPGIVGGHHLLPLSIAIE